jgi:hypothetical protein
MGPLVAFDQVAGTVAFFRKGIVWTVDSGNGAISFAFPQGSTFFFETSNCTGTAWVNTGRSRCRSRHRSASVELGLSGPAQARLCSTPRGVP